jgi:hypothetical protein
MVRIVSSRFVQPRSYIYGRLMFIIEPLPFVTAFIDELNKGIKEYQPNEHLSRTQKAWLDFCIMAVLITNTVCWAKFEQASLGRYSRAALSWIFRNAKIPWELLLHISVKVVLQRYGITEGCIGIDDSDKKRSKATKKISGVHKIKDKTSGGYIMGQSLVFLVLITPKITIPVGFSFYVPDPELSAWYKEIKKCKKQGVPKNQRPKKPPKNENYPTIPEIALMLLEQFKIYHPDIKIKCIFADALYGTAKFLDGASKIFGGIQVISQLRYNQNVSYRNKKITVEEYFSRHPGTTQTIIIRGGKKVSVVVGSARLHVCAHGKKRFVIALKYEGEKEYRYIVAKELSWQTLDIVQAYTLRWLVEVFFEDWKTYEGWGRLTKQTGEEGSSRSLILSLLADHCLFFHTDQLALLENKLPANTVGSLISKVKVECLLAFIRKIVSGQDPEAKLNILAETLERNVIKLSPSSKHMVNRDIGRLEPSQTLKYKYAA